MRKTLISSLVFFISTSFADGPRYQVFPQLKGLVVNYNVAGSNVETTLYATNHERAPVICDASMITNRQETSKGRDTVIAPGKTAAFSFRHGKSITDIRLYLMCEATKNTGTENDTASAAELPAQEPKTEKTPAQQKSIPVVEEDLDRY
jgi:hypothetical protein